MRTVYISREKLEEMIQEAYLGVVEKQIREGLLRGAEEGRMNALSEVRYINPGRSESYHGKVRKGYDYYKTRKEDPIKNGDKIRVFHGCQLKTALDWCINGTSGRDWHPRTYSYEAGMNPLGIFVTIDFETAKNFGYDHECKCVIEFTVDASDLETPVWNDSNSYFVQGSNPLPFSSKEDRDLQKQKYRDDAINEPDIYYDRNTTISRDYIRNSDKPEMADRLMNMGEYQALFMGNLDPNQIKRIWINPRDEETGHINTTKSYIPLTRAEFLKRYRNTEFADNYGRNPAPLGKTKVYRPNEDFAGWDDFFDRIDVRQEDRDELMNDIMRLDNYKEFVSHEMYPKQIVQAFGKEYFDKNYNRFGQ